MSIPERRDMRKVDRPVINLHHFDPYGSKSCKTSLNEPNLAGLRFSTAKHPRRLPFPQQAPLPQASPLKQ